MKHHSIITKCLIAVLLLAGASACSSSSGTGPAGPASITGALPPMYKFFDLGTLSGGASSEAYGIAESGDTLIAGQATNSAGENNAVLWRGVPPVIKNLGVLPG